MLFDFMSKIDRNKQKKTDLDYTGEETVPK